MRKSFFDFGFFIDGALMKAPTESGLPPEQHDALMRRFFPNEAPASAPAPLGLDPEAHDALMRRFPRAATPASPPAPATPEITKETHSGMTPERIATLMPWEHEALGDRLDKYREARPRQSRTGLRPHGADEEGTPMRSIGVVMPSSNIQPMLIHKYEEDVDEDGLTPMRQRVNGLLGKESNEQAMDRIHTRKHVQNGTLTDGNEFMNLAGLAGHRANQIAAEYAKWHESGGGPLPDLSKYEDPVIRRKDGSTWDYRDAFKRMVDLDARASEHDHRHGWLDRSFGDSFAIDDPDHVHSIHPTRIWDRIHGMMQPRIGHNPHDPEDRFDYFGPSTLGSTQGRNLDVKRPALTISDLKRGLPISQQIPLVRELLKLGLRHQKMSRIHANQSESLVQKSGKMRGALMKAPTGSGLSEEEHAALARRFPRAATPASPPATPEITEETHSGMTPERIARLIPSQYDALGERLDNYRAARPRQSRTGLRPHGADEEGTPMRSIGVVMPRDNVQPMLIHKDEEAVGADGLTPMHRRWRQHMNEALEQESARKMHTRKCADNHAQYGTLTDGNEFMNLAGLAGHRANQIAAEYAKWHESGGGPRPDLSKYEDPVIRRKDGSTWDYRDAFKRMVDLDTRASQYDWRHGWLADTFGDSFAIDDPDHVHSIHPTRIWDRIHGMMQPKTRGRNLDVERPALTTSDLKRGLPLSQQIPFVRELLTLGLRHQQMSRAHANQSESPVQKSAAWQRKEGKNPKGGLNAKGRESAKREGHNLKPPVKSGDNPRRASFLARMGGSPGPEYDEHGEPTRLLLALRVWGASSKADAKKKAAAMSERLKNKKLAKGRGEDARQAYLTPAYAASGLSERDFPTGQMMKRTPPQGSSRRGSYFQLGTSHVGVFGENRHIRVEASEPERGDATLIDWVHVMPGTTVKPRHVREIFDGLYNAGYTKPMKWNAIRENNEKYSLRPARRDRFFGPLAAQWDKYVASKQAKKNKADAKKKA